MYFISIYCSYIIKIGENNEIARKRKKTARFTKNQ